MATSDSVPEADLADGDQLPDDNNVTSRTVSPDAVKRPGDSHLASGEEQGDSHLEGLAVESLSLAGNTDEGGPWDGSQCEDGAQDRLSHSGTDSEEVGSLPESSASVHSAVSGTSSYLCGERGQSEVRRLVRRSLEKQRKEQVRRTRPKKETKRVAAGGHKREKRGHKVKIKEVLQGGFF